MSRKEMVASQTILPTRYVRTPLRITANWIVEWQRWLISRHWRYARFRFALPLKADICRHNTRVALANLAATH
jgi:hypothetical protein